MEDAGVKIRCPYCKGNGQRCIYCDGTGSLEVGDAVEPSPPGALRGERGGGGGIEAGKGDPGAMSSPRPWGQDTHFAFHRPQIANFERPGLTFVLTV